MPSISFCLAKAETHQPEVGAFLVADRIPLLINFEWQRDSVIISRFRLTEAFFYRFRYSSISFWMPVISVLDANISGKLVRSSPVSLFSLSAGDMLS